MVQPASLSLPQNWMYARRWRELRPRTTQTSKNHTSTKIKKDLYAGDILASGTISGPEWYSWGCLLELTWNGTEPLTLEDVTQRAFLEDGDAVVIRGWAGDEDQRISMGEIRNSVVPSPQA